MNVSTMLIEDLSIPVDLLMINNDYCIYWDCHCYKM